jgi:hypothetical protein
MYVLHLTIFQGTYDTKVDCAEDDDDVEVPVIKLSVSCHKHAACMSQMIYSFKMLVV